jgi:hypothetical protein
MGDAFSRYLRTSSDSEVLLNVFADAIHKCHAEQPNQVSERVSVWSYRKAAGGIPESARELVSGIPSWACGHAR